MLIRDVFKCRASEDTIHFVIGKVQFFPKCYVVIFINYNITNLIKWNSEQVIS